MRILRTAFVVFAAVMAWVVVDVFRQRSKSGEDEVPLERLEPATGATKERAEPGEATSTREVGEILSGAWHVFDPKGPDRDYRGVLREGGRRIPIGIYLRGKDAQLTYRDPETKESARFHVRWKENERDFFRIGEGGRTIRLAGAERTRGLAGTGLSLEDLAMPCLAWPHAEAVSGERMKGRATWRLRFVNPDAGGRFAQVQIWVHQSMGLVMSRVGYDRQGRPLQRVQVVDVLKTKTGMSVRRLRVDRIDPAANKVVGVTYLELERPTVVDAD